MTRLIDADALKYNIKHAKGLYFDEELVFKIIDQAPRVVRMKGEWVSPTKNTDFSNRDLFSDCSICGHTQMDETNFCPNCGADMRGGKNDNYC